MRVRAQTADSLTIDQTYTFVVEDLTAPFITSVTTAGLKTLVVTFSEPIAVDDGPYSALRVREISGRVTPTAPMYIEAENADFVTDSIGDFVVISGATNAVNNTSFEIDGIILPLYY